MIKEDVEENVKHEESNEALLDGYPVDLEFHHASHQRTESFREFFRR